MREYCIDNVGLKQFEIDWRAEMVLVYNLPRVALKSPRVLIHVHRFIVPRQDANKKNADALGNIPGCPTLIAADEVSFDGTSTAH